MKFLLSKRITLNIYMPTFFYRILLFIIVVKCIYQSIMYRLYFSNHQARQTFALYLTFISAVLKKCALEKRSDNSSSRLVLMFLIKASKNLSIPLEIEVSFSTH